MAEFPDNLKYAETHEWARLETDGTVTVGITDHAQDALGDVVYVELPEADVQLAAKAEAGVVESVKAASDIYSPISGRVLEVNAELEDAPETVNESPYDRGWFYKIQPDDPEELNALLSVEEYSKICEAEDH